MTGLVNGSMSMLNDVRQARQDRKGCHHHLFCKIVDGKIHNVAGSLFGAWISSPLYTFSKIQDPHNALIISLARETLSEVRL